MRRAGLPTTSAKFGTSFVLGDRIAEGIKKESGVSDNLFENGLCLPSGSNLTEEEFSRIFDCLDTIFSKH
jgi:dTDP-4-amino-4,6-dideoxygalactose transaminase